MLVETSFGTIIVPYRRISVRDIGGLWAPRPGAGTSCGTQGPFIAGPGAKVVLLESPLETTLASADSRRRGSAEEVGDFEAKVEDGGSSGGHDDGVC